MSYFNILVLFRVNTLSFCENVDITYNVSITSLTQKKKKKLLQAKHAYVLVYGTLQN